jgi:di/tricarboxylate transporter
VIGLLAAVAGLSAAEVLEPAFAIVAAAVVAILLRCVTTRQAYEAIDWKTLVVVGGMIPFSVAMEVTGSDRALAEGIVALFQDAGPQVLFAGLLLAVLLGTQVLGNATVAVLIGPLAWRLAEAAGADPKPFLIGAALCTSASFMMPVAHEATLLVMGPGGYRGRDYLRFGLPFALITWAVTVAVLPWFYPLT